MTLWQNQKGQATVEAAFLLPLVLTGMLLALQPGILLFNQAVMESAAWDACRLLETLPEGKELQAEAYVYRRLQAIPNTAPFHVGMWTVEVSGSQCSPQVSVRIRHAAEPLPVIGVFMGALGFAGRDGLCWQEVTAQRQARDAWIEGSELGPNPEEWILKWEGDV